MNKIRFAIIGTSNVAKRFLKAASMYEEIEVAALYSRTLERGNKFAGEYGIPKVYTDVEELSEAPDIDAVYVASPTYCHAKQATMMLRNKKHVLCEKPIATNSQELETMVLIANTNNVIILEAIRNVFTPGYDVILDNLDKIGQIRRITLNYCQYSSRYDSFKAGKVLNAFKPELSNGALMDIGVYCVYFLVSLFGMPYGVTAKGHIIPDSIDSTGTLIGKYTDKQFEIVYSKVTDSFVPSEIQGEDGNILFGPVTAPAKIRVIMRNGEKETIRPEIIKPDMYYEIGYFLRMIRGEISSDKYNQWSITTMHIMDDARKQMDIAYPADY